MHTVIGLLLLLCASAPGAADSPAPCRLDHRDLRLQAHTEPDDGEWGPTLVVSVQDALRTLTRLMVPESRPIEACWWEQADGDPAPEIVIGFGRSADTAAGVRILEWDGRELLQTPAPALPAEGEYRFVVRGGSVWAFPTGGVDARLAYRLEGAAWTAAEGTAP